MDSVDPKKGDSGFAKATFKELCVGGKASLSDSGNTMSSQGKAKMRKIFEDALKWLDNH